MNKNEKFVITINRELGSGGRTVGRLLAQRLGVEFYDKAQLQALQEKFNLTPEEIEKLKGSEHGTWVELQRVARSADGYELVKERVWKTNPGEEEQETTTEDMFKVESELLLGLAEAGSCVVAGRSGFHIFRNHPNHLSVLIQASMDSRVERVARKQNLSPEEARRVIDRVDQMRETYVNHYTGTSRYDTRNYQLVICADGKTEEQLADLILNYIG